MSDRPNVTTNDLMRSFHESLVRFSALGEFEEWLNDEGVDSDAMATIMSFMCDSELNAGVPTAILQLQAFTAGWDCHRDLRGERE